MELGPNSYCIRMKFLLNPSGVLIAFDPNAYGIRQKYRFHFKESL